MKKKMTRRALPGVLSVPVLLAQRAAEVPADDQAAVIERRTRSNSEALRQFKIDMMVEPAFRFKA